jgi:PTS system nitrogen regulatory IIA component
MADRARPHLLSLAEAAHLLQVSERTIRRWCDSFGLPGHGKGTGLGFDRDELIEWADRHSFKLAADVNAEPDGPLPALRPAIERGGVHRAVGGDDVESVLADAVRRLHLPPAIDREFFHQVLLAREDLGSTALGQGYAVPHVRSPLVLHVAEPLVGLCLLEKPVDWAALDRQPVHTLFVVIAPGVRSHLHLLSRVGFALRDATVRGHIERRAPDEVLLEALGVLDRRLGSARS